MTLIFPAGRVSLALRGLACLLGVLLAAAPQAGEPVDYEVLALDTLNGGLAFVGLDRFPDMALEPRLDAPGVESVERRVLRTPEEWRGFWERVQGELGTLGRNLPLDFGRYMVIVSAAGRHAFEGGATYVMDVDASDAELVVSIEETPASCPGPSATLSPLAVIRVERSTKPVRFEVETLPCPDTGSR